MLSLVRNDIGRDIYLAKKNEDRDLPFGFIDRESIRYFVSTRHLVFGLFKNFFFRFLREVQKMNRQAHNFSPLLQRYTLFCKTVID